MNKKLNIVLSFCCILLGGLIGCGGSGGGDSEIVQEDQSITKVVIEESFGVEGSLWKPVSDGHSSGSGNLVILLTSRYATQFDSCEVPLNDGTIGQLICINDQPWTHVPFSCFSNGGRQTWRANFRCSSAARVEATCKSGTTEVKFTVPAAQLSQVCTRFG